MIQMRLSKDCAKIIILAQSFDLKIRRTSSELIPLIRKTLLRDWAPDTIASLEEETSRRSAKKRWH